MRLTVKVLAAVCVGICMPAWAASFDCAQAASRIEKAICASALVSGLDSDLTAAYQAALKERLDPAALKAAQRAWIKETRNACQDETCLATAYQRRIAALTAADEVAPAVGNKDTGGTTVGDIEKSGPANAPKDIDAQRSALVSNTQVEADKPAVAPVADGASASVSPKASEPPVSTQSAPSTRETNPRPAAVAPPSGVIKQGDTTATLLGVIDAATFFGVLVGLPIFLRRRNLSWTIALGGGFIGACLALVGVAVLTGQASSGGAKAMELFKWFLLMVVSWFLYDIGKRAKSGAPLNSKALIAFGLVTYDILFVLFFAGAFDPRPTVKPGDDYVCEYARLPDNGASDCGADKAHPFWPNPYATQRELDGKSLEQYNEERREIWQRFADVAQFYKHRHDEPNHPSSQGAADDDTGLAGGLLIVAATCAVLFGTMYLLERLPALGNWILHGSDPVALRILAVPLWTTGAVVALISIAVCLVIAYKIARRMAQRAGVLPYAWEK